MMGNQIPQNEFDNLYALLELVKDDKRFADKVKELSARVDDAKRIRQDATDNNLKAEDNRRIAQSILEEAKAKHAETTALKREQERLAVEAAATLDRVKKDHELLDGKLKAHADHCKNTEAAFADREQALQYREQAVADAERKIEALREQTANELAERKKNAQAENESYLSQARDELWQAEQVKKEADRLIAEIRKKQADFREFVTKLAV